MPWHFITDKFLKAWVHFNCNTVVFSKVSNLCTICSFLRLSTGFLGKQEVVAVQLRWAGHAPGKARVRGWTHYKGQDVSLSWPCLACPLALPTPSIVQRRHEMSAAVPLGWGGAPYNTWWMRSAAGTPVPWGLARILASRGWSHTFCCALCVRAGEEGWFRKVTSSQAETKLQPI